MKREYKYPDTNTFHYVNVNPKNNFVGDCVIRALSVGMNKTWNDVYKDLCKLGYKMKALPNDKKVFYKYLEMNGFIRVKQPRKKDNTKYTGSEFCEIFGIDCIVNIGGHHVVAIREGKIFDIWNSSKKCIGNYWVKSEE